MPSQHKAPQTGIAAPGSPTQETVLCEMQRILKEWAKSVGMKSYENLF